MSLNFFSFLGDDEIDIADQPTQPLPGKPSTYDAELVQETIFAAQAERRRRDCFVCKMVRECETGIYEPQIEEEDLCDEHWQRFHILWHQDRANLSTLHTIVMYAKRRNDWPPYTPAYPPAYPPDPSD